MNEEFHVPAVRVRFFSKETNLTFLGTVIDETSYSYIVMPDDNLMEIDEWDKDNCDVIR